MDNLTPGALDWALKHITKFGDTDLLPVPVEYEAVAHAWGWLKDELATLDLNEYRVGSSQRFLVPKPDGGFRVATQLDPIDALVYTAMIYEIAPAIEKARVAPEKHIACSYRVALDPSGAFFRSDNGWPAFHARSLELAKKTKVRAVLLADISDFYNQIYHHRLENALDGADVPQERRQSLAGFLSQITATQSRGIPVGPYASILLAETCLNDVDGFLLRKGCPHTRYADDFRMFCPSRRKAIQALHDLTEYLHTSQRLSLVPGKTRIRNVPAFLKYDLRDPEQVEEAARQALLEDTLREMSAAAMGRYDGEIEEIEPDEELLNDTTRENLKYLFEGCVTTRPLHLGLARHLLRKATKLRTNVLLGSSMKSLDILSPVLRDLVRYLRVAIPKKSAGIYGTKLLDHLQKSDFADVPYIHLWILDLFRARPDLASAGVTLAAAERAEGLVGIRMTALLAREYRQDDWVRSQKEIWRNHRDWDRRAVLAAASVLPKDERKHWLGMVQGTSSGLDRAVAQWSSTV